MTFTYIKYFFIRYVTGFIRKLIKICLGDVIMDWNVIVGSFDQNLKLVEAKFIPNFPGSYFADPFLLEVNGKIFIFVEEYFWNHAIGKISLIEFNDFDLRHHGTIIEENFHLSFPFIFKKNGNIYMVPESHQNANVSLYEATEFPYQWTRKTHIIPDVCVSDTVLFENESHYFALCNEETSRFGDRLTNLKLYASKKDESTKFPHFCYVEDISNEAKRARNGGLFEWRDGFCRVNQKPSFNQYGKEIFVNRISIEVADNQVVYEENRINDFDALIESVSKEYTGCHHLHVLEEKNLFVCDVSTLRFKRKFLLQLEQFSPKFSLKIKRFVANIN